MGCSQGKTEAVIVEDQPISPEQNQAEEEEERKQMAENEARNASKRQERREKRKDINNLVTDKLGKDKLWEEVEQAFQKYDLDWDGRLSAVEAQEYIKMWAEKRMEKEDAKEVATFDDIDKNKDGYIDKQELYDFIKD